MKSVIGSLLSLRLNILLLLCFGSACLWSQTISLRINEIDITQFPVVRLKVDVIHDGTSSFNLAAAQYTILENSVFQNIERVDCATDTATRLSIALLLDRSGSMADKVGPFGWPIPDPDSTKIRTAKAAVGTFISRLGEKDEAAVFSFSSSQPGSTFFQVNQDFTKDTLLLHNALVPIRAGGGTYLWKAIRETIARIRNRSGRRYVVVLTDGQSSRGDDPIQFAINDALAARIPVYTIGLGGDVSTNELTDIANRTGGKFYRAPDASTLEGIYLEIAKIILTDGCGLRYISSNPCLDGTRRDLSISVRGSGYYAEADTFYTVARNLTQFTLAVDATIPVTAGDRVEVPIYVREFVSDLEPLSFDISLTYDTTFLMLPRPVTEGSMCDRIVVAQSEPVPGLLRYQLQNHVPATTTGVVFRIEFVSRVTRRDTTTPITFSNALFTQTCPTDLILEHGSVAITHCRADYTLRSDSLIVASSGTDIIIPVRISPSLLSGESFHLSLNVSTDPSLLAIDSILTAGTLTETMTRRIIPVSGSEWALQFDGVPADTNGALFFLKCAIPWRRQSAATSITIRDIQFDSRCLTTILAEPVQLLIDGACERISAERPTAESIVNMPNPFNPVTRLRLSLHHAGAVHLWVADDAGRRVATLIERELMEGEYDVLFDGSTLPSGTYFAVMERAGRFTVRRMILLR